MFSFTGKRTVIFPPYISIMGPMCAFYAILWLINVSHGGMLFFWLYDLTIRYAHRFQYLMLFCLISVFDFPFALCLCLFPVPVYLGCLLMWWWTRSTRLPTWTTRFCCTTASGSIIICRTSVAHLLHSCSKDLVAWVSDIFTWNCYFAVIVGLVMRAACMRLE